MAVVFDFLHLFRKHLGGLASEDLLLLPKQLTEELVTSTGSEGLLAMIHMVGVVVQGGICVHVCVEGKSGGRVGVGAYVHRVRVSTNTMQNNT